eukprot:s683_g13.t1
MESQNNTEPLRHRFGRSFSYLIENLTCLDSFFKVGREFIQKAAQIEVCSLSLLLFSPTLAVCLDPCSPLAKSSFQILSDFRRPPGCRVGLGSLRLRGQSRMHGWFTHGPVPGWMRAMMIQGSPTQTGLSCGEPMVNQLAPSCGWKRKL